MNSWRVLYLKVTHLAKFVNSFKIISYCLHFLQFSSFRVLRRLVVLIAHSAQMEADVIATKKQAESATAAAKQMMENSDNKVVSCITLATVNIFYLKKNAQILFRTDQHPVIWNILWLVLTKMYFYVKKNIVSTVLFHITSLLFYMQKKERQTNDFAL